MPNTQQPPTHNEVIEELAMAVTHSEQGEYAKNEAFVREKISALLLAQKKQIEERVSKIVLENTPLHLTREYRATDKMRDSILHDIHAVKEALSE